MLKGIWLERKCCQDLISNDFQVCLTCSASCSSAYPLFSWADLESEAEFPAFLPRSFRKETRTINICGTQTHSRSHVNFSDVYASHVYSWGQYNTQTGYKMFWKTLQKHNILTGKELNSNCSLNTQNLNASQVKESQGVTYKMHTHSRFHFWPPCFTKGHILHSRSLNFLKTILSATYKLRSD